jgi:hypothetical protein
MANRLPAYILRDCSLMIEGNVRIGQCAEIALPKLSEQTEDMRNAGMIKPREVWLGFEKTEASFKETAFDPAIMKLYGVAGGVDKRVIAYGYLMDEDGTEHSGRLEMICRIKTMGGGDWATGEKAESEYEIAVHSGQLFMDDEDIYAFDDFDVSVGGKPLMPGRAAALRLS